MEVQELLGASETTVATAALLLSGSPSLERWRRFILHEGYNRFPSAGIGLPAEKPGAFGRRGWGAAWPMAYPPSVRSSCAIASGS